MSSHKVQKSHTTMSSSKSDLSSDECKFPHGESIGCAYCVRYLNHIDILQSILDDNGIYYQPLKPIRKGDKIISDTMAQLDLSEERLESLVNEYYTQDTFQKGYKGIIDFIHTYVIRDDDTPTDIVYICADPSKKVFHYYDVEGLQKDIRCRALMDALYDPLIKKITKIYRILINRIYQEDDVLIVGESSDSDSDDEYDEDIDEVIAEELHDSGDKRKQKEASDNSKTADEQVNHAVAIFLNLKKSIGKVRKPIVDELVTLLTL
ncbi:MAG: hypothetical protein PHG66_00205 [Candidatus Colwellbacteria bacterium]|nr:hypothetical protein [Candidatus Colwellbacteria bacterium]